MERSEHCESDHHAPTASIPTTVAKGPETIGELHPDGKLLPTPAGTPAATVMATSGGQIACAEALIFLID
ncbi:MAG: hypothetical protein QNL59_03985 [Actinomycetota bacterium]